MQEALPKTAVQSTSRGIGGRGRLNGDALFQGVATFFALLILVIAVVTVTTIVYNSWPTLTKYGWGFVASDVWDPTVKMLFGARPFIFGTLVTALLALLMAGLVGIGVALMLVELHLPRWFRVPVSFLVELLAAIPSVVFGVWGVFVVIPLMQQDVDPALQRVLGWTPFFGDDVSGGHSLLTASLVLAVMIVPTVTAISRDVIRVVPDHQREAMLALGATRWEMINGAVLPFARPGIIGALILALGRAVGETIAVTMVIGNNVYIGPNLFHGADTLASRIAASLGEAADLQLAGLFELALILFLVSVALNALARLLVWSISHGSGQVV
ncbi:MAG TPA: phosphate ABC transporter permease subunit PstC [Chloroflexota bacterium]